LTGKVFNIEHEQDATAVQMYLDEDMDRQVIVVVRDPSFEVNEDDYLRVSGEVADQFEGENAFGAEVSVPRILGTDYKRISAIAALNPTLHRAGSQTRNLASLVITIQKIEYAAEETRVYVKATNNGGEETSMDTDPKVVARGNQIESDSNFEYELPELSYELSPGATTKGVLIYPKLPRSGVTISFSGYDADYNDISAQFQYERCEAPVEDDASIQLRPLRGRALRAWPRSRRLRRRLRCLEFAGSESEDSPAPGQSGTESGLFHSR
jgi:hypothetical protein